MSRKGRRKKRIAPMELILNVARLSHEGRGIAEHEGQVVFSDMALPREVVKCSITSRRSTYLSGVATEVIETSDDRQNPPCVHFGICGGCNLQHMKSQAQIDFKTQTVIDLFKQIAGMHVNPLAPPIKGADLGYRHKARLAVRYVEKKGGVLVGFREKASHFVAQIDSCQVLHPKVSNLIIPLKQCLTTLEAKASIPQIEVAVGENTQGETQVALVFRHLESLSEADTQALLALGKSHGLHIYLQPKGPETVYKIWPKDVPDRLFYQLKPFALQLGFHPLDFTQINPEINALMVAEAIDWLDLQAEDRVLDLFCGLGNFTLALARGALQVVGVEASAEMVNRSKENAKANGLDQHCEFYAADLYADDLSAANQATWYSQHYNKALIDPPRSGAQPLLACLPELGVEALVYVSCNPSTLARDAGQLKTLGYELIKLRVMDMFPHTSHVETMAYFERRLS